MRFLLARIMTHPSHTPVKKSTGRFGALQGWKVLSKRTYEPRKLERTLGKSTYDITGSNSRGRPFYGSSRSIDKIFCNPSYINDSPIILASFIWYSLQMYQTRYFYCYLLIFAWVNINTMTKAAKAWCDTDLVTIWLSDCLVSCGLCQCI
jgi:hypothetical protein